MKFSEEHYNKLKPLEHYWKTFKKSGTVLSLDQRDINILEEVQFDLHGIKLNKSCNNCVSDALTTSFIQFDKFHITNENLKNTIGQVEAGRKERPRISNQNRS